MGPPREPPHGAPSGPQRAFYAGPSNYAKGAPRGGPSTTADPHSVYMITFDNTIFIVAVDIVAAVLLSACARGAS